MLSGCAVFSHAPVLPNRNLLSKDQLILHTNFRLPEQHRLVEDLRVLRSDLEHRLLLPSGGEPVHVYLFESQEDYDRYLHTHYPDLPERRAFFHETDTRLAVFAYWGDHIGEDLRHEVTHGYLHASLRNLPIWLDEGLAEYFETPRGHGGLNRTHLIWLQSASRDSQWKPNLERLESIRDGHDMEQGDYAESWLWTHWLLSTEPSRGKLLLDHLKQLREHGAMTPLSGAIAAQVANPNDAVLRYLEQLTIQSGD